MEFAVTVRKGKGDKTSTIPLARAQKESHTIKLEVRETMPERLNQMLCSSPGWEPGSQVNQFVKSFRNANLFRTFIFVYNFYSISHHRIEFPMRLSKII